MIHNFDETDILFVVVEPLRRRPPTTRDGDTACCMDRPPSTRDGMFAYGVSSDSGHPTFPSKKLYAKAYDPGSVETMFLI